MSQPDGASTSSGSPNTGTSHLPWHLIPSFKPGETDVNDYTRRLEFLANLWPQEHLAQLAPRVCLLCEGTAFPKVVRLDASKLKVASVDGIKLLVQTLGGVWGQSKLETKYERFEKALYGTVQKSDELHSSYVARHEVHFEELLSMGTTLEEMRAYILIRNSGLSADDKKRIIVDCGGTLDYAKVTNSLQLLGSKFFAEVQSGGQKNTARTKTYDVFQVDEMEHEIDDPEENVLLTYDHFEEPDLDALLAEGDADALTVTQFEDALVESLQSDSDVATCLTTYLEARKRISEKVKGRGFWVPNKGQKGKSKGKTKGGFRNKFRKPLAQRILESTCRLCNQPGHWKAECPLRNKTNPQSSTAAFAGMTVIDPTSNDPSLLSAAAFHEFDEPDGNDPPNDAIAFVAEEQCFMTMSRGLQHVSDRISNRYPSQSLLTKVLSKCTGQFLSRLPASCRSVSSPKTDSTCDPLCQNRDCDPKCSNLHVPAEVVHFASHGTLGIVDLGASMSVIGQKQFMELCQSLPRSVKNSMKESSCAISFRFGNDSTVLGKRSVYFPIGHKWIRVVIVPSNTPFLIANSVFRSLGAVIDTQMNRIYFKELDRTVPIQISERKLYHLDLLDLLIPERGVQNTEAHVSLTAAGKDEQLLHDHSQGVGEGKQKPNPMQVTPLCSSEGWTDDQGPTPLKQFATKTSRDREASTSNKCSSVVCCQHNRLSACTVIDSQSCTPPNDVPGFHGHAHQPAGRSPASPHYERRDPRDCRTDSDDEVHRSERLHNSVRQDTCGSDLRVHDDRNQVHDVVCRNLQAQQEATTCQVSEVHPTHGGGHGEEACREQGQEQGRLETTGIECADRSGGIGFCGGSRMGSGPSRESYRAHGHAESNGGDGGRHATDPCSPEDTGRRNSVESEVDDVETLPIQPLLLTDLLEAWQDIQHPDDVLDPINVDVGENIFQSLSYNPIAKEMWQYFASKGVKPDSPLLKTHRIDVLEVYCSNSSQLTQQARAQGLWAERHSVQDGDLSHQSGRFRLYERLLRLRPKHVWLAPRCRAWCRWNVLNMQKSPETAAKIIQDRRDDQIHLQLCDAIFEFQTLRHSSSHVHLEQPVGSEMLYQEEMERIMSQTWTARCDMCTAGKLQHPVTQKLMQKGTQVVTTSQIMYRSLDALRCDHSHVHDHVAGSFPDPKLGRINVSQYAELYTSVFARKVARCIKCSAQVRERSMSHFAEALAAKSSIKPDDLPAPKRRRTSKTPEHPDNNPETTNSNTSHNNPFHKVIQLAFDTAPKVGKRYTSQGEMFQLAQQLFPEYQLHGVEVCKGADRLRPPPTDLKSKQWPYRFTMGIKRDGSGYYVDEQWEEWGRLNRKNLIRRGIPSRLMVTMFAKLKSTDEPKPPGDFQPEADVTAKRQCIRPEASLPARVEVPSSSGDPVHHKLVNPMPRSETDHEKPITNPEPSTVRRHGPKFLQLSSEERQQLMRMHHNLGHPDATVLGNVLRDQGWPQVAIDGIRDMHCSACFERQKPRLSRPSHLGQPREFNEMVSMDAVTWKNSQGQEFLFYHMIDAGTNFQVAFYCDQRPTSRQLIRLINQHWISWAGPMKQLLTDSAGEFCSEEFCTYLQGMDIKGSTIAGGAHWQLGRCERHGYILQTMLDKYQQSQPVVTEDEFEQALQSCCTAKNRPIPTSWIQP